MTHDEMIAVISAQRDGKTIERRCTDKGVELHKLFWVLPAESLEKFSSEDRISTVDDLRQWHVMPTEALFNFMFWDYRIKPGP